MRVLGRPCCIRFLSCLRRSLDSLVRQRYSSQDRKPRRMSSRPPIAIAAISPPLSPVFVSFDELLDETGLLENTPVTKDSEATVGVSEVMLSGMLEADSETSKKVFPVALADLVAAALDVELACIANSSA